MKGNRGNRTPVHRRTCQAPGTANYDPHGWSHGTPFPLAAPAPAVQPLTAFEEFVSGLDVPANLLHRDPRVRRWVHAHKNYYYVPEELLHQLDEKVLMDGWEI